MEGGPDKGPLTVLALPTEPTDATELDSAGGEGLTDLLIDMGFLANSMRRPPRVVSLDGSMWPASFTNPIN